MTAVEQQCETVTRQEWLAALRERYAPHAVPAEVVRVAEVLAEVHIPVKVNGHPDLSDLSARVVDVAMQVISQAGLETWTDSLELRRQPRFKDALEPGRLLDVFARTLAAEPTLGPTEGTRTDAVDIRSTDVQKARSRKRDPFALPETAPQTAVDAPNDPAVADGGTRPAIAAILSDEKGVTTGDAPGGHQVATRTPDREVDYRAALHDTSRQQLSANALLAGLVICQRCWQSKELFASQSTVAEWMHITNTKTVRKAVTELEGAGFLTKVGTKANRVYHYRLTIPFR